MSIYVDMARSLATMTIRQSSRDPVQDVEKRWTVEGYL